MPTDDAENTQQKAADAEDQHRMAQPVHQLVQAWQAPHCNHPQRNSDGGHYRAAKDIHQLHLPVVGNRQREVRVEKEAGG